MARVDAATHLAKSRALKEEIKQLRKEMAKMIDPSTQNVDPMDEEEGMESADESNPLTQMRVCLMSTFEA